MNGPHVRLRLLCSRQSTQSDLQRALEPHVESFLKQNPSRLEVDRRELIAHMRRLYEAEYGKSAFSRDFGEGEIPLSPNNSFQYADYEPEYGRYGGVKGMAVAEEHFGFSSETVLSLLLREGDQPIQALAGRSLQLMLQFVQDFYSQAAEIAAFFRLYAQHWQAYLGDASVHESKLEQAYARQAKQLKDAVNRTRTTQAGDAFLSSDLFQGWGEHARWLATRTRELYRDGNLMFDPPVQSEEEAVRRLLMSYLHMTNNRIGLSVGIEVYIAYVLSRVLEELGNEGAARS